MGKGGAQNGTEAGQGREAAGQGRRRGSSAAEAEWGGYVAMQHVCDGGGPGMDMKMGTTMETGNGSQWGTGGNGGREGTGTGWGRDGDEIGKDQAERRQGVRERVGGAV